DGPSQLISLIYLSKAAGDAAVENNIEKVNMAQPFEYYRKRHFRFQNKAFSKQAQHLQHFSLPKRGYGLLMEDDMEMSYVFFS
ncbi:hypothetical protein ACJX0J_036080, partial [Zea mays]